MFEIKEIRKSRSLFLSKSSLNSTKGQASDLQTTYILSSALVAYSKLLMIRANMMIDDVFLCYGLSMCYVMYHCPETSLTLQWGQRNLEIVLWILLSFKRYMLFYFMYVCPKTSPTLQWGQKSLEIALRISVFP